MEKKAIDYSFFPKSSEILRSIRRVQQFGAAPKPVKRQLDTLGTSGSDTPIVSVGERDAHGKTSDPWEKEADQRAKVKDQMDVIHSAALIEQHYGEEFLLNKAKARLQSCGSAFLVEKYGPANYKYVSSFHCKQKYCPRCAAKKTKLLIAKYANFFDMATGEAAIMLKDHDVCFLTITLRHGEESRQGWYFKELQTHFRNSLKYGAFNKYIKGGAYQTEVNHGANGFHIHRHCIVLIPKVFRMALSGEWFTNAKGWREYRAKNTYVEDELRKAWHQKTGDSFQIDLKPIDPSRPLEKSLCEIFKYLSNGTEDKKGIVAGVIVKEIVRAPREKFYGRFGLLHNQKALNINDKDAYQAGEGDPLHVEAPLYIGRGLVRKKRGWSFQNVTPIHPTAEKSAHAIFRESVQNKTKSAIIAAQDASFKKHEINCPIPDF